MTNADAEQMQQLTGISQLTYIDVSFDVTDQRQVFCATVADIRVYGHGTSGVAWYVVRVFDGRRCGGRVLWGSGSGVRDSGLGVGACCACRGSKETRAERAKHDRCDGRG